MWIFSAIANAVGRNFIGSPNYLYDLIFNRAKADGGVTEAQQCTIDQISYIEKTGVLPQASLLVTPTSYKEGKLYADLPINGNGDFTATRATTATRVNSAGLVDLVPYNLVSWSEMFSDASWTKSNVTISPNSISAPNGFLTADTLTGNGVSGSHGILNGFTPVISTTYTLSCYVKADTNNFIQITAAASAFGSSFFANFDIANGVVGNYGAPVLNPTIENAGDGWYRVSVSAVALTGVNVGAIGIYLISSNTSVRLETNTLTTSVFAWGAQLVEGTSARDYLRTETRLNIPRIDYSLGGCPNILLEPQRTNLALQSSSFDSASWVGSAGITVNSHISPSGVMDADTLTDSSNTIYQTKVQNYTITANASYTTSIFIRKTTGAVTSYPGLTLLFSGGSSRIIRLIFNTTTGTFNFEISGLPAVNSYSARVVDFNADYWRVELTTQDNQSNTSLQLLLSPAISLDGITITSSATGSVVAWGAQLEAGAYATSYIPTTTASVTRNADGITRNNIFTNGLITAAGGTWFVELRNDFIALRSASGGGIFINTGTASNTGNGFSIRNGDASTTRFGIGKFVGGVFMPLFVLSTSNAKIAIKWNGTTADVFVNGVKVVAATSFTPIAMENLIMEGSQKLAFINEMALFPTPLTDAQCIALTA